LTDSHRDPARGGSLPAVAADPGATRRVLLRALLGLLAGLVLLGSGVDLPRTATAPRSPASAAAAAATHEAQQRDSGEVVVRPGGLAAVPAPASPGAGLLPGAGPDVAPHLIASPQSRPPTAPLPAARVLAAGSRAPPVPAGH